MRDVKRSAAARKRLAQALAKQLGAGWSAGKPGRSDGLVVEHAPTRLEFIGVPGDGASFLVALRTLSRQDVERLSDGKFYGLYCHALPRADAEALVRSLGFRLCSDAEMKWLARDGGRTEYVLDAVAKLKSSGGDSRKISSRFGLSDMFLRQWTQKSVTAWTQPELVDEPHQAQGLSASLFAKDDQGKAAVRLAHDWPMARARRPPAPTRD